VLNPEVTAITRVSVKLCEPAMLPESMTTVLIAKLLWSLQELLAVHVSDHRKGEESNCLPNFAAFRPLTIICLFLSAVTSADCCAGHHHREGIWKQSCLQVWPVAVHGQR